jgi:hypothetical protein
MMWLFLFDFCLFVAGDEKKSFVEIVEELYEYLREREI